MSPQTSSITDLPEPLPPAPAVAVWPTLDGRPPRIIAHRGASGYRPEHTLEAYALAVAQGADAIEPDLVASRDAVLFARHDLGLARSTDIAALPRFASRAREIDGRRDWSVAEFAAAEIETLRAVQAYPQRGTQFDGRFGVPRFAEVLDLALRAAHTRAAVVVDAEIKHPEVFAALGIDLIAALLRDLEPRALTGPQAPVWLECFDHAFLRAAHARCGNPCLALVETMPAGAAARDAALRALAPWARGIAVARHLLWNDDGADAGLVAAAHAQGLEIHAWTFRDDQSPAPFADPREELIAAFALGVDALFCDFPDRAVRARAGYLPAAPVISLR
jgi:glycerophosphoryl diester phosphodiesterase